MKERAYYLRIKFIALAVTLTITPVLSSFNAEIARSDSLLLRISFPVHCGAALAAVSRDLAAIVYQWLQPRTYTLYE